MSLKQVLHSSSFRSRTRNPGFACLASTLIPAILVTVLVALAQSSAYAQSANALFLNQNPAPTNTSPGVAIFSGHAGQAGVAGTPTDGTTWLVGSAFGQPVGSELFWNGTQEILTEYAVGDIPSLTALQGGVVLFTIHSEELGPGATFTFQFDAGTPRPQGQLSIDPVTGRFFYIPAANDKLPFNILITASKEGQTDVQLVEIQPRPSLPQEEDLVRPGQARPAEDSPEYIVRSQIYSETSEVFNGSLRPTREVTISGKVVIIENGNPNRLWQSYDSALDVRSLTINAEQVVVRNVWNLHSTKVVFNARSVRYEAGGRIEQAYGVQVVDGDFEWLTPYTVRAVIAYAKDLYLYGYLQEARNLLEDYADKLTTLEASPQWAAVDEMLQMEFGQTAGEIVGLLHRLDSNLDYFGHPAGWVPNLSFEANLGLFSSEAESAIRVLYLSYWLGNVASNLQQKVDGMANSRGQLAADFSGLTNDLSATQTRLVDLEIRASVTESNVTRLQTALNNRVEELRRMAEEAAAKARKKAKKNAWRKVANQVGGILSVSPIGTPIVNAIGAGLSLAANIQQPRDLLNPENLAQLETLASGFKGGAFKDSVGSIKDTVRTLNPGQIGKIGWSDYKHNISERGKDLSKKLKDNQSKLKKREASAKHVLDMLGLVKAEHPEMNQRFGDAQADGLMDQIAGAVTELKQLNTDITDDLQQMAWLTDEIRRSVLAVDALNRDVSALNAILDHRAIVHLKEMDRHAKERLRKYQYYLAKSYEYRFLEPYPGDLNLNAIFDGMVAIAQAGRSNGGLLSAGDFQSLKALYENELAEVTFAVIERFQQNPPARRAPVSLAFSPSELAALNSGEPVRVNMIESYLLLAGDEDVRINEIDLTSFTMAVEGPPQQNATISLRLVHSGESKVRSGTNDFYFRHDQESDVWPFEWEVRYELNTREATRIVRSPADESLLQYLLSLRGVATTSSNLLLFSRPAMWADMQLVRSETRYLPNYTITNLLIKTSYDFRSRPNNLVALDVSVSDPRVAPYIIVDRVDKRGRQDGVGRFYRTYERGAVVRATAPQAFGIWRFDRWVDAFGQNLPGGLGTSNTVSLTLNNNWAIQARYVSTDSDEDGLPDDWERRFYPGLAQGPSDDTDQDGWGSFLEFLNQTSPLLLDTDGDGMSDGGEGVAGTDATDQASTLRLLTPVLESASTVRLEWASVPGKIYVVETGSQFGPAIWQDAATVTAASTTESVRIARGQSSHSYRLRVVDEFSLRLRVVLEPGVTIRLNWPSTAGKTYVLEMTSQLGSSMWQTVATVTANGSVASVEIPHGQLQGFYRLKVDSP